MLGLEMEPSLGLYVTTAKLISQKLHSTVLQIAKIEMHLLIGNVEERRVKVGEANNLSQ